MSKEIDDFLGELGTEEGDVFANEAEDIPEFRDSEETAAIETETEKPEPFHKDPKIRNFIEKQVSKALSSRPTETERFARESESEETTDDLTNALVRIVGNDTPEKRAAVNDLRKALAGKAREEASGYFTSKQSEAKKAEEEALSRLNQALEGIEDSYDVDLSSNSPSARKTRSEFLAFAQRMAPKNQYGQVTEYPDLNETFDVFRKVSKTQTVPSNNSRAKEIASRGMERSTQTRQSAPAKRITWDTVESDIDRLTR